jgi:hypothetical protein
MEILALHPTHAEVAAKFIYEKLRPPVLSDVISRTNGPIALTPLADLLGC